MNYLVTVLIISASQSIFASPLDIYKLEDGHTNWQYLANTTSSILILTLCFIAVRLFISRRKARNYNRELEEQVQKRTATLDQSNRMLEESNRALSTEIEQHRETTKSLRLSEDYIKDILRSMPLMLIGLNKDGIVTQWNYRCEEISGVSAEQATGKNLWQVYPTVTVSPSQIKQAQDENKPITLKYTERGRYHFVITIYPLKKQAHTEVIVLIDDVTKRVLAENMLIQRDKMSSMGELAGSMAHDLNSPLQTMLRDIKGIQSSLKGTQHATAIENTISHGKQASAIITNLLEFSNARDGEKKFSDVTKILDHSLELANRCLSNPVLQFEDIAIQKDYAENLPEVSCFAAELQQVFLNLLRHCFIALSENQKPDHQPTIKILASKFYDALWIKIQHNGKGLSPEEQQFILEPFFTNEIPNEEYNSGNRLSYSSFIITELHKGQIVVTSDIDIGTTFHMQMQFE